jgi:hypothetical protein
VGFFGGPRQLSKHEEFSDILNFHRYWQGHEKERDKGGADAFRRDLDACVELREKTGKPLISSEACWGSTDDAERAAIIDFHLKELNEREIGWLIHALSHSRIADLHREDAGPVINPGVMHCVEPDGSIRPHHEIINSYL